MRKTTWTPIHHVRCWEQATSTAAALVRFKTDWTIIDLMKKIKQASNLLHFLHEPTMITSHCDQQKQIPHSIWKQQFYNLQFTSRSTEDILVQFHSHLNHPASALVNFLCAVISNYASIAHCRLNLGLNYHGTHYSHQHLVGKRC